MQKNDVIIIDIRTTEEWLETGIIPDSQTIEFFDSKGNSDADQWLQQLHQLQNSPQQAVILVCRSGNRSKKVGDYLTKKLGMENIYHLENGLTSWIQAGKKTEIACLTQLSCAE